MFCICFFHMAIQSAWQHLKHLNKLICINELIDTFTMEMTRGRSRGSDVNG